MDIDEIAHERGLDIDIWCAIGLETRCCRHYRFFESIFFLERTYIFGSIGRSLGRIDETYDGEEYKIINK